MEPARKVYVCLLLLLVLGLASPPLSGQGTEEEQTRFGDIRLAAPLSTLPFQCPEPVVCEGPYESAWIRVWHGDGVIQRIDVVYAGKKAQSQEEIKSSPITLAQAIKAHSIRNGHTAAKLGFGGNIGALRVIVDVANGVAYFADGVMPGSIVNEVHYLPATDPVMAVASYSPLSEDGRWLVKAAWAAERYKNLQADREPGKPEGSGAEEQFTRQELAVRLHKMSQALRVYAKATLMLSEHVSQCLRTNQKPAPELSANLKKAFARLTESTHEALDFISNHPDVVTPEDVEALPLDLAGQAEAKMNELIQEGFTK